MKNWARRGMALTCITSLSFCVLTFSPNALAQGEKTPKKSPMIADVQQLQEVVVTATRRDSSIMDVPFSVNVQSEQDVQRLNTFNLEDLSRNVAGLAIQNLGPGQSVVNIRGVSSGQIVRDQPGVKEQVGIYLDDTPISLSLFTPDIDLYDVSRVETLRGPQGTLFGSGSIGGTVRYITNQPQLNVNEAKAQLDLNTIDGGSNGGHFKTAFNAPVGEKAAVRVVTYGTQYPGFIDALREGGGGGGTTTSTTATAGEGALPSCGSRRAICPSPHACFIRTSTWADSTARNFLTCLPTLIPLTRYVPVSLAGGSNFCC